MSDIDRILPENDEFQNRLYNWVGENPLSSFIFGNIQDRLDSNFEFDSESPLQSLNELEGFENLQVLAEELIDDFNSLPYTYSLFLKLPRSVSTRFIHAMDDTEYILSDSLSLVSPDEDFNTSFPNPPAHNPSKSFISLDFLDKKTEWDSDDLYIRFEVEGFITSYEQTRPLIKFKETCKSLLGISLALRLLNFESNYLNSSFESKIVVYQRKEESWSARQNHSFSESFSNRFQSLGIWNTWVDNHEDQLDYIISSELKKIKTVFESPDDNETILKSSQWLYDSYCSENQLLGFIQSITSIEILLGDKSISDIIGLGELLRNRCAYLIGRSKSQRDEILKDFKRIYDTRSKIVHRGKSNLTQDEIDDLYKLKWLCNRAIQEEISLLSKDEDHKQ
ncbi:hypothetical protein ACKGJO_02415 [Gracilimonas sp. Q87]|uniref:hypothetical protein n=1 Tax=Gracilimonas sp. Q87 TaxID=3384766 RepID=UPI00398422D2